MTTEWLKQTGTEQPSRSKSKRYADEKRVFTTKWKDVLDWARTMRYTAFVAPRQNLTLALNGSIFRSLGFRLRLQ